MTDREAVTGTDAAGSAPLRDQPAPAPLGPESLTWRYFGDWRTLLLAPWAGAMQNAHPALGAGVARHSRFFEERWQRLLRSLYPIGGVVYDGPRAAETARTVRDYHRAIGGVDDQGRRYHALDPDTFYWAHATFFMLTVLTAERFGPGLTDAQRDQLYAEHVAWYRLYGMSMRPVPPDWPSFVTYWDRMCAEVLEDTAAARAVLDLRDLDRPPALGWLPWPLWCAARVPFRLLFTWLTVGLLPEAVRRRFGYRWTAADERLFRLAGRAVHLGWRLVPPSRRFHPRARAGWRRATGSRPSDTDTDTAPVETPARNLPPADRRDDPRHYVPAAARRAPHVSP
ncbi:oxygenase MpaB family protein [Pseudofrankia asymbiotica]|uniref:oxygenase MpaB family protein n=1 Tax=Pseudofrankia asymbiotica TaxID=1834516 RepID=UPI0009D7878D